MLFGLLGVAHSSVAHVLSATFFADLEVCIAVKLGQIGGRNTTLPVKAIHILTDDEFEVVLLRELDQSHMSLGGVRLLNSCSYGCNR